MQDLTLVVGGTGKTGRRVAERLEVQGRAVRVGSRSGQPPFDWENRGTWEPALRGTAAAYLSYFPDLAAPGAREAVGALAELAVASGTRRLVLLSGRGEEEAQLAEEALRASGADWTIVRCSWFMQNFSEGYLLEPVLSGEVALPVGDVPEPFVDADDIADVAVAALTEDRHVGQLYELTRPGPGAARLPRLPRLRPPGRGRPRLDRTLSVRTMSQSVYGLTLVSALACQKAPLAGLSLCAREDSNLHGPFSPQGPQPCRTSVRPVRTPQFAGESSRFRDGWDRSFCATVATALPRTLL
jgi:uncharacterized protein YbjT (DUF2867 family)